MQHSAMRRVIRSAISKGQTQSSGRTITSTSSSLLSSFSTCSSPSTTTTTTTSHIYNRQHKRNFSSRVTTSSTLSRGGKDEEGHDDSQQHNNPPPAPRVAELRSDTFTKPDAQMYIAMLDAKVGDDVYGEDPTVKQLEAMGAEMMGKEAALFVPSATMANLLSVGAWCGRGESVILGDESHIFYYEQGGASWIMGAVMHTLPNNADGTLLLEGKKSIREAIESRGGGKDPHYVKHGLVAVENTHNRCGGAILSPAYMKDLGDVCKAAHLPLHVDGSRLLNASAALNISPSKLVEHADSVTLCLSKGLGAPIGALVIGSKDMVARAHRLRKAVGGGMRQAGIMAAAGIVGIKVRGPKLNEDHARAKSLARGLAAIPGIIIDASKVKTNIMYFDLDPSKFNNLARFQTQKRSGDDTDNTTTNNNRILSPSHAPGWYNDVTDVVKPGMTLSAAFAALLHRTHGCRIGSYGDTRLRAVTHHQVTDDDIERLLEGAEAAAALLS